MASFSSRTAEGGSIVVSAAGLATSLGGLVTACAAARAGITRRVPLGVAVPNPGEDEPAELRGHVYPDAVGTEDYGRLVALLAPALEEGLGAAQLDILDLRAKVYVVLPLEQDRAALREIDEAEEQFPLGPEDFVIKRLCALVLPGLEPGRTQVVRSDHSGIIQCLASACQEIASGTIDRAILCSADSLVDEMTIMGLAGQRRIRSAAASDGLFPGEAGAALVLETQRGAVRRRASPLAVIGPVSHQPAPSPSTEEEKDAENEDGSVSGSALADAIAAVEAASPGTSDSITGLIDDFNGESQRARYFWTNLVRVGTRSKSLRRLLQIQRWSPAEVFGDVGVVTGALHLCVALRAFARGYAPGESFLVCNTSDSGAAGAMVVSAPARP